MGAVPWWPEERREVTLHRILVHMIAETNRHAGHADIVRETIDGAVGHRADNSNMQEADQGWWDDYRAAVEAAAQSADQKARESGEESSGTGTSAGTDVPGG